MIMFQKEFANYDDMIKYLGMVDKVHKSSFEFKNGLWVLDVVKFDSISPEMHEVMDALIKNYEDMAMGEKMSEWEKKMFKDAFLKGVNFAEDVGAYL